MNSPRTPPAVTTPDDTDVPRIRSARCAEGWRSTTLQVGGATHDVFVSPDGDRYIRARGNERADLIADYSDNPKHHGLNPIIRLRLLETSGRARKARREQRLAARGEKAKAAKKKTVRRKL